MTQQLDDALAPCEIERRTARLLRIAKRSGFFAMTIGDAQLFQEQLGCEWHVALEKAVNRNCYDLPRE